MQTAIVTIGRNIKEQPMNDLDWEKFREDTFRVIKNWACDIYTRNALGRGEYTHDDGTKVIEESYTWAFSIRETFNNSHIENLIQDLKAIKGRYNQESIALVLGQTTFC